MFADMINNFADFFYYKYVNGHNVHSVNLLGLIGFRIFYWLRLKTLWMSSGYERHLNELERHMCKAFPKRCFDRDVPF